MTAFYSLLERDNLVKNSFVADKWDLQRFEGKYFDRAETITDWPADTKFCASTPKYDGDLDDFVVNNAGVPLITGRLLALIKKHKTPAFQALPTRVVSCGGLDQAAFILNFTETIIGLDLERTPFDRYPPDWSTVPLRGKVWTIRAPTLKGADVEGWDLFRCSEYPPRLFASEKFKKVFKANRMTGVSFHRVSLS
jgi:hypothetical protein